MPAAEFCISVSCACCRILHFCLVCLLQNSALLSRMPAALFWTSVLRACCKILHFCLACLLQNSALLSRMPAAEFCASPADSGTAFSNQHCSPVPVRSQPFIVQFLLSKSLALWQKLGTLIDRSQIGECKAGRTGSLQQIIKLSGYIWSYIFTIPTSGGEAWHRQSEWNELPENKLHQIFPVLKKCIVCPRTNRKEETVMARLHIGHSFITHSFLLKGEEPPVCIGCDQHLTIKHILLVWILLKWERATLQLNHYVCCFRIFRLKRFLTFWKKLIFLEKSKFEIIFSYVCVIHPLSMVLKLYIDPF